LREGRSAPTDLLGALISAADPEEGREAVFSNRQVRDHALTFFLAGHETTSLALTYTLRLLALHPAIQDRLRQELKSVADPVGGEISLQALEQCKFLDQVIDESMRLFPPAAVTAREAIHQDVIHGYRVEPETTVVIPTWAIHRDSRFYGADVEKFRPERWTPEFRKALPRAAYLPFGFGPRMCIGFGFAIQEMKLILAAILLKHRVSMDQKDSELRLQSSITMRPRDPVWLKVSAV
jgi:cytochrome P450